MDLTKVEKNELRENVARGVAWLNATQPATWRQDIRTTIDSDSPLRMDNCEACLLSRAVGEQYSLALKKLHPTWKLARRRLWAVQHGFVIPYSQWKRDPLTRHMIWRYLEELWMEELCKEVHNG